VDVVGVELEDVDEEGVELEDVELVEADVRGVPMGLSWEEGVGTGPGRRRRRSTRRPFAGLRTLPKATGRSASEPVVVPEQPVQEQESPTMSAVEA